ncbi:peptide-methionine (R)-S-oxide reductase MsrB [Simiduia litorea]|uniref:peptide-methionine (R)-S-oxide reductase MsrB n=1 Tax=Simiduia litorea TaxID=1435348 RepID=UPI0036F3A520
MSDESKNDDGFWRSTLTPEEYYVCREKGTERPFTGRYWDEKRPGLYHCKCCGEQLFDAATKFDAGCGWPSFYAPLVKGNIKEVMDSSHGMLRTEVTCRNCGCHLGHVFPDGPQPTGERYCINSASITHEKDGAKADARHSEGEE